MLPRDNAHHGVEFVMQNIMQNRYDYFAAFLDADEFNGLGLFKESTQP